MICVVNLPSSLFWQFLLHLVTKLWLQRPPWCWSLSPPFPLPSSLCQMFMLFLCTAAKMGIQFLVMAMVLGAEEREPSAVRSSYSAPQGSVHWWWTRGSSSGRRSRSPLVVGKLWAGRCLWSLHGGREAELAPEVVTQHSPPCASCLGCEVGLKVQSHKQPPPCLRIQQTPEKSTQCGEPGPILYPAGERVLPSEGKTSNQAGTRCREMEAPCVCPPVVKERGASSLRGASPEFFIFSLAVCSQNNRGQMLAFSFPCR